MFAHFIFDLVSEDRRPPASSQLKQNIFLNEVRWMYESWVSTDGGKKNNFSPTKKTTTKNRTDSRSQHPWDYPVNLSRRASHRVISATSGKVVGSTFTTHWMMICSFLANRSEVTGTLKNVCPSRFLLPPPGDPATATTPAGRPLHHRHFR